MFEPKLQKIIEAYEHMDEYPTRFSDTVRIYNIVWDEEDVEESSELADISSDETTVEYVAEYEGDHRGRTDEIDRYLKEQYGCNTVPEYDVELLNCEVLESVEGDSEVEEFEHDADDGVEVSRDADGKPLYVGDTALVDVGNDNWVDCTVKSIFNDGLGDVASVVTVNGRSFTVHADELIKE